MIVFNWLCLDMSEARPLEPRLRTPDFYSSFSHLCTCLLCTFSFLGTNSRLTEHNT